MTGSELVNQIKERGYWRILFEPLDYEEKLKPPRACKEIVERNAVDFRGWSYPHVPNRCDDTTAIQSGENYWQGWLNWEGHHKEFWRMYQSGQFVHYIGLLEDWDDNYERKSMWQRENVAVKPGDVLGILKTVFMITEAFQFLSRLTVEGIYDKGVRVTIGLYNTEGRELYVDGYNRAPLFQERKTVSSTITNAEELTKEQIISDPKELALQKIIYIFESFGWDPPNIEAIKNDQINLLLRKLV